MFSSSSSYDNEEVKDIDKDMYSVMEDIKDRGVIIINTDEDIDNDVKDIKKGGEKNKNNNGNDNDSTEAEDDTYSEMEDIKNRDVRIDENRTSTFDYRQILSQRDNDDRRRMNSVNRSFKKPYGSQSYSSSQQPCIYWLNGICRFGQTCRHLHSIPQPLPYMSPPILTSPPETVALSALSSYATSSSEKTINKEAEVSSNDQNKSKTKTAKSNMKLKDKDCTIFPTYGLSPKKKGKKKPISGVTPKSDLEHLSSTSNSSTLELSKELPEVDDSKLCEEFKASLNFDEHLSNNINDNSSHEEIFLDLFQHSPKHFLQLIHLNEKTYISEEISNQILNSRNKPTSLQSLQNIISQFQFRIKKRDLIALNKDVLLAYYKQRQEVRNQLSLAIQENESHCKDTDDSSSKTEDDDYNEIESNDRYNTHQSSYDSHKQYSTPSSSSTASYASNSGYPYPKERKLDSDTNTDDQGQMYIPNDEVYYYTYANPVTGLQYIYPSSMAQGYPNMTPDQLSVEYMNPYMYGYYPSMEYYPDIYSQQTASSVFSNPQQLTRSRDNTTISSTTAIVSPIIASSISTSDDRNASNIDYYTPYDLHYQKNLSNAGTGNKGFYGRRGHGTANYGTGRRDFSDVRPYPNIPYPRGGGTRRRYDQQQIPLGRGDARQFHHASTES